MLKTTCLLVVAMVANIASAEGIKFEDPEIILDGSGYLYPSPVYEDIDSDGQRELLIGDLWGHLMVYENTSDDGSPAWGEPVSLQMAGKGFKVPNW